MFLRLYCSLSSGVDGSPAPEIASDPVTFSVEDGLTGSETKKIQSDVVVNGIPYFRKLYLRGGRQAMHYH